MAQSLQLNFRVSLEGIYSALFELPPLGSGNTKLKAHTRTFGSPPRLVSIK